MGQCWICQSEAFNSRCSDPCRHIIIWKIVLWAGKLLEKLNSNKLVGVRGAFQSHFGGKQKSQWRKMWERICFICRTPHLGNWLPLVQQDTPAAMPWNDLWTFYRATSLEGWNNRSKDRFLMDFQDQIVPVGIWWTPRGQAFVLIWLTGEMTSGTRGEALGCEVAACGPCQWEEIAMNFAWLVAFEVLEVGR